MLAANFAWIATTSNCVIEVLFAKVINTQPITLKTKTSAMKIVLVFFMLTILTACSHKTLGLFFDVPPPKPKTEQTEEPDASATTSKGYLGSWDQINTDYENLPIEALTNWEDVLEALPKDYKGKADWSAAVEQKVIRPRTGADPRAQLASVFKYDFIISAEKPKNEAFFPHSAHTEWLGCKNCHISLYPYKRNPSTMKEMRKGASCGTCHGKVAFSLKQCKRCHLNR
jgi:c(7)-type cytochrome triheme protein